LVLNLSRERGAALQKEEEVAHLQDDFPPFL
jgi:hypothetical protein